MKNEKKELGQYFTNPDIAMFMAKSILDERTETVLDPAVGHGVFLKCLEKISTKKLKYTAYDIDSQMIEKIKNDNLSEIELYEGDYLADITERKYDGVICNPPYNKFQKIPKRKEYISNFKENFGIDMSGYCNLCVYFLIKSLNELKKNGKCAYIMPYEFLNTGYGTEIKRFMLNDRRLKTIYRINYNINLFDDATTTSCIILFDGAKHNSVNFITVNCVEELFGDEFKNSESHSFGELDPKEKWNIYFESRKSQYKNLVMFKNIGRVSRGIATGNNDFFCLSQADMKDRKISKHSTVRCITKSADVTKAVFTEWEYSNIEKANKRVYLFDGSRAKTTSDFNYIKYGESVDADKGYLNSHRKPWYLLEKREAADIWISVFNRGKLKVVRNETDVKNLTTFHGVYLKEYDKKTTDVFFCYLLTPICREILYANKREYGNGLDKFEPNDLNNSKVFDVSKLDAVDFEGVLAIYEKIKQNGVCEEYLTELNYIFSEYIV